MAAKATKKSANSELIDKAVKVWLKIDQTYSKVFKDLVVVGQGLNAFYSEYETELTKKKLSAKLVQLFPYMSKQERYALRELAKNAPEIKKWIVANKVRSATASYLVTGWKRSEKAAVATGDQGGKAISAKATSDKATSDKATSDKATSDKATATTSAKAEKAEKADTTTTSIAGVRVTDVIPDSSRICQNLNLVCDQVVKAFNADLFTADQLNVVDRNLRKTLKHLNNVSTMDKLALGR
jgi:hypothetical protein